MPELLSIGEAKTHLRVLTSDLDDDITAKLAAARDWCERWTQRTIRESTSRRLDLYDWWCGVLDLPYPPLLAVTHIKYYDEDDVDTTLASSNYHVVVSAEGGGWVEWDDDADLPSVADRPDAIRITYTAGYANLEAVPPVIVQAWKTKLTEYWLLGPGASDADLRGADANDKSTKHLLGTVDWTGYA